jgi:predicted secreted hydrolase
MKPILRLLLLVSTALTALAAPESAWRLSLPGWKYEFPRDHGSHPGFKTEWWYFTGHLESAQGEQFGYQLTFFRQGVRPPSAAAAPASRFVISDLPFAHFAFTDVAKQRFLFSQRLSRGAFGEAGFDATAADGRKRLAWLDDWSLKMTPDQEFTLHATHDGVELKLQARALKPWVQHGTNGISQKAEGAGRASHYYSGTRLQTEGTVIIDGREVAVKGTSWFDHEWATNQLASDQIGWNWFSLILSDSTELMLYQMRLRGGGVDPHSSGTFVDATGKAQHLQVGDYSLTPIRHWKSARSGGEYPIEWRVEVPALQIDLIVTTPMPAQELVLEPIAYWEGLVQAKGTRSGKPIQGQGYVELTGYAGELVGLATPSEEAVP